MWNTRLTTVVQSVVLTQCEGDKGWACAMCSLFSGCTHPVQGQWLCRLHCDVNFFTFWETEDANVAVFLSFLMRPETLTLFRSTFSHWWGQFYSFFGSVTCGFLTLRLSFRMFCVDAIDKWIYNAENLWSCQCSQSYLTSHWNVVLWTQFRTDDFKGAMLRVLVSLFPCVYLCEVSCTVFPCFLVLLPPL